ncbi:HEAT repeat domain-containing protein [Muricauda sp. JGD-17]|uniref:HEAT repeat domain-containing protein n=1 Tax=Flagellimonas ochracea TaxID=2696472 RepID=A0A964WYF0_9FLAO|nr:HEAT repeat domain-containing protein [Allomuricauda ochracea]NAY92753.1 HEAT repeat domain-containing protein [Allomuricauda ochracea]
MMNKENFEIQVMEYLSGDMPEKNRAQFEKLLAKNENLSKEFEGLMNIWSKVENLDAPKPTAKMDESFFDALVQEVDKKTKKSFWILLQEMVFSAFKPQLAYGFLLVGVGLVIGYFFSPGEMPDENQKIVQVDEPLEEVRQRLVLTLLEQPSANQRLQGVGEANKIAQVDSIVVKALLQTLNNDPNVNVRLAAIESLTNYLDNPTVRQGLVQSIAHQESPILQVTLANLMVALQEKASIAPFRQLLQEKTLDTTVKKKIENSIESII